MTFPIGPAPLSESEFREALAKVDAGIVSVNASLARIFEHGNQAMVYLPPGLDVGLRAALEELADQITEFAESIGKVIANPGDPMTLLDTAKAWTASVGGPMSAMSGKVTTDQLRIDNVAPEDAFFGPVGDRGGGCGPGRLHRDHRGVFSAAT